MPGGVDTAADGGGENTEPLPIVDGAGTPEIRSSEPLRPLTDLSYDFAGSRRSSRSRPRVALPGGLPRLLSKGVAVTAASVIGVAAAAAVWLLWRESSATSAPSPPAADSTAQLRALVPAGFGDSCQPEPSAPPVVAQLTCTAHAGPSTPPSGRFMTAQNSADLQILLQTIVEDAQVVVCPGNIQSPGPWRRNATPSQVAGTLVCATRANRALVAWTTDDRRLVSMVEANAQGPSMAQLYVWWTTHS